MAKKIPEINNSFYDTLGNRWLTAQDDPIALLRAEGAVKQAWLEGQLEQRLGRGSWRILDVGCGAGFLAHGLAKKGHEVQGLDLSLGSLRTAQRIPSTARFHRGNAFQLPFRDGTFDVVCALDFLEHVENPQAVIAEAARVLKPGGLFFFHTFNRNWLAWCVIIKGVEIFVSNTPRHMHLLRLFIKPAELEAYCQQCGLKVLAFAGIRPDFKRIAFWKMLLTRKVPKSFRFAMTPSLRLSYIGVASNQT